MSTTDKLKNAAQGAKGKVKEAHGKAVGDPALQAEGKGDQAVSDLKQAGEKGKDAVRHTANTGPEDRGTVVKHDAKRAVKKVKDATKH